MTFFAKGIDLFDVKINDVHPLSTLFQLYHGGTIK
jgi:hypothetical protein